MSGATTARKKAVHAVIVITPIFHQLRSTHFLIAMPATAQPPAYALERLPGGFCSLAQPHKCSNPSKPFAAGGVPGSKHGWP
jgi:hypothetical protein